MTLLQWLLRIAFAALAFCIVWFGLPWALQLIFHLAWPDAVVGLIAVIAFLAVLTYHWWLPARVVA